MLRTLGERLKETRIAAGYSQGRLAEACGVSIPVVARMESGDGGVKLASWVDALRILGKLSNFEILLPALQPTPYDIADVKKKSRQRALRSDSKRKTSKWNWGD